MRPTKVPRPDEGWGWQRATRLQPAARRNWVPAIVDSHLDESSASEAIRLSEIADSQAPSLYLEAVPSPSPRDGLLEVLVRAEAPARTACVEKGSAAACCIRRFGYRSGDAGGF
jgi:hypothetical protein